MKHYSIITGFAKYPTGILSEPLKTIFIYDLTRSL